MKKKSSTAKASKTPVPSSIAWALAEAERRAHVATAKREKKGKDIDERGAKKNNAQHLSESLALQLAAALRSRFPGIKPERLADGTDVGTEAPIPTARKPKRIDVNYSTPQLGLALGISIKTVLAKDKNSSRYTHNLTRHVTELRTEASDYHERQPYSVLVAIVFLPSDGFDDGGAGRSQTPSSFASAVVAYRPWAGRDRPTDDRELFELFYVALFDPDGNVVFFDVRDAPTRTGRPVAGLKTLPQVLDEIESAFRKRNPAPFRFAGE